jgi:hypothetical protein
MIYYHPIDLKIIFFQKIMDELTKNLLPTASAVTNFAAASMSGYNPLSLNHPNYHRLPQRASKGGFENYLSKPEPGVR